MNTVVHAAESAAHVHTDELTQVLNALMALRRGDVSVRLPYGGAGVFGRIAEVYNDLAERSGELSEEFARLSEVVGKEGKLSKRALVPDARGVWLENIRPAGPAGQAPTPAATRTTGARASATISHVPQVRLILPPDERMSGPRRSVTTRWGGSGHA